MQPVKRGGRTNLLAGGLSVLGGDIKATLMEWDDQIRRKIEEIDYKLKHLPQTNFELGKKFAGEGKVKDAIFRFRIATYFAPNYTDAWYHLGSALIARGSKPKAIQALKRTLQLDPAHAEAKYMLATIDPNLLAPQDRPIHMPVHMVEGFFGKVAGEYDMIEGASGYVGPQHFHAVVMALFVGRRVTKMLDLGCGTGLSSMPFRKDVQTIIGVDITPAMVTRAELARIAGVPVFDQVLTLNANSVQAIWPVAGCDLVIALNVMPYLGEAAAFFAHAAQALGHGGVFAVSIEPHSANSGFGVVPATGRFGHSLDYLRGIAQTAGLQLAGQDAIQLYTTTKALVLFFTKPFPHQA